MLKISEMAKLAQTTRRTLIFYDEQGLFKPIYKNESGYRFYDYQQLYDLLFILGLRNLDIPLNKIRTIKNDLQHHHSSQELLSAQQRIDDKITELTRIREIIQHKTTEKVDLIQPTLYQPVMAKRAETIFWCSDKSVNCTEAEVAELFSQFYQQLAPVSIMSIGQSGFLTDLSVANPRGYDNAAFRVIKEVTNSNIQTTALPTITKVAGHYACIFVENTAQGIQRGLQSLATFCQTHNLKAQTKLWQINTEGVIVGTGASQYGWLEFLVE
ncbi:MerR family transcriptional regulator [Convivina praedatoris]|uniref:HTH merR-type domain-containing protein n=1 Tax=Convivina praedatoris TaxID=2880963 RepID=A0ABM9D1G9_9LACO|nr:MerR family transcriptional regulator [Convivina sp. LMG 32447]CAH1851665.1 hypothetical protein R077815_00371 [Convivina sp. LMG 32447]CAH1853725.1 hypothetical protein LMG032447_00703 [Convivina sp. LMG 32447]CAH1854336.1 hypothetical protein R078138_00859 [Convivina sp. LMG 32447]